MTDPINATDVGQADYMKLFMQELTYQDPLKPVDNREFMAQMAQFSALQQATTTNERLAELLWANYGNRSVSLLGKEVKIEGAESYGQIQAVRFPENQMPEVRVLMDKGGDSWIKADKIMEVITQSPKDIK